MKQQKGFRLSDNVCDKLKIIAEYEDISETECVSRAIDMFYGYYQSMFAKEEIAKKKDSNSIRV
jgi:predicted transcriptional regulator